MPNNILHREQRCCHAAEARTQCTSVPPPSPGLMQQTTPTNTHTHTHTHTHDSCSSLLALGSINLIQRQPKQFIACCMQLVTKCCTRHYLPHQASGHICWPWSIEEQQRDLLKASQPPVHTRHNTKHAATALTASTLHTRIHMAFNVPQWFLLC